MPVTPAGKASAAETHDAVAQPVHGQAGVREGAIVDQMNEFRLGANRRSDR